jgi:hypothetical protein
MFDLPSKSATLVNDQQHLHCTAHPGMPGYGLQVSKIKTLRVSEGF